MHYDMYYERNIEYAQLKLSNEYQNAYCLFTVVRLILKYPRILEICMSANEN